MSNWWCLQHDSPECPHHKLKSVRHCINYDTPGDCDMKYTKTKQQS